MQRMIRESDFRSRVRSVQARWTADERKERAAEGRRRTEQFLKFIAPEPPETEIWAVGAAMSDDITRLSQSADEQ